MSSSSKAAESSAAVSLGSILNALDEAVANGAPQIVIDALSVLAAEVGQALILIGLHDDGAWQLAIAAKSAAKSASTILNSVAV